MLLQNHDYKNKIINTWTFIRKCFVIEGLWILFQCINISWHIIIVFNSSQLHVRWITIIINLCLSMSISIHKKDVCCCIFYVIIQCYQGKQTHTTRIIVIKIKYCFYYYRDGLKDLQGISPTHANEDFSKMLKFKYFI